MHDLSPSLSGPDGVPGAIAPNLTRPSVARLAEALQRGELVLYYQPKINMRSGQVVGVEALLRWQHPNHGLLLPNAFLPEVEDDELIIGIGERVIRDALEQIVTWHHQGVHVAASVNLAPRQLQQPQFLAMLRGCLEDHPDASPSLLELEILESAALQNTAHVRKVIETCRDWGVSFSLDDFGTGYSSLAYLRDIPADTLKIDQRFVRDLLDDEDDRNLVEGIVSLAKVFRRSVVAEGVEHPEQGLLLMRLGCDIGQGFGIARPMPAAALAEWIAHYQPHPDWAQWADVPWEMEDFPLLMAQYDHYQWTQGIVDYLDGDILALTGQELTDAQRCRFGQWYHHQGLARYGHLEEFTALDEIHTAVHLLAPEVVRLCDAGQMAQAEAQARQLLALRDDLLERLAKLQKAVATHPLPRGEMVERARLSLAHRKPGSTQRNQIRILVVDDTPANIELLANALSEDYTVKFATSGAKALELAERPDKPDLILLDVMMPGMDGYEVCRRLKINPATRDIPVIFITAKTDLADQVRGFNIGGVDYISKPFELPVVAARVRIHLKLKLRTDLLESQASLDGLTGIPNRRQLDEILQIEWRRAARDLLSLSFLMLDVDHFKAYNDHYGHGAGDECLRKVSDAMVSAQLRPGDFVSRYGGEEFAVVLPGCNSIGARALGERFCQLIEAMHIPHARSPTAAHVTVSVGCATFKPAHGGSLTQILAEADKALYRAKHNGRNRVYSVDESLN